MKVADGELESCNPSNGAAIDWPGIVAMADVRAAALGIAVHDAD